MAAVIKGYREFDADLNLIASCLTRLGRGAHGVSSREPVGDVGERERVGGIPKDANAQAADNASDSLEEKIEHMAMLLEQNVDLDALLDAMPTYEVPPRIAHELAMERADRTKEAGTSKSPTRIASLATRRFVSTTQRI